MSLLAMFKGRGPTGYGFASTAESVTEGLDLSGKTILLTGCRSGLGAEASRVLSLRGAHVLGTARRLAEAQQSCAALPIPGTGYACELSDPATVRTCLDRIKHDGHRLDAIVCNAGIMALPTRHKAHGYELQFFTNHIGHFMLVTGLLDRLTDNGRVVMLSSAAHAQAPRGGIRFDDLAADKHYNAWGNYAQSKLANLLFAKALQRRFTGTANTAYAVHPGIVRTGLTRSMGIATKIAMVIASPLLLKSVPQGAATEVFAAVHPEARHLAGRYLVDCNAGKPSRYGDDPGLAERLWKVSEQIVEALP